MIVSGSTVNARRAGSTLATATAPTSTSGAASHTHTVGESAPGVTRASHRATRIDPSMPAAVPAPASRNPSAST